MKKFQAPPSPKKKPSDSGYLRYTSIAYQIIAVIAIGFIAGYFADKVLALSFPVFKVLFSFGGVIAALYFVIKEISKKDE